MIEYIVILLLIAVLSLKNKHLTEHARNVWLVIIFLYLTLLFGLRYRVGIDTLNYMKLNDILPSLSEINVVNFFSLGLEPFYVILTAICKEISDEFFVLQIAHAIILNFCIIIFFRRHCVNPFSALFWYAVLYALYFSTEIVREGIAISIFLLNYDNLANRNIRRYYLFSVCSILFHMSALITLIFPFCLNLRLDRKFFFIIIIVSIIVVPCAEYFSQYFTADIFADRVDKYINLANSNRLNFNWVIFAFARLVLLPLTILFIARISKYNDPMAAMVCVGVIFGVGSLLLEVFFSRFTNYTAIFLCAFMSNMISKVPKAKKYFLCLFLYVTVVWGKYYQEKYVIWFPYHSVLNPIEDKDRELFWSNSFNH